MSALRINDVWKRYGATPVLKGIDLAIDSGEFAILVGPSGCGKSTLLNIIAGLDNASQGSIEIGDRPMNGIAAKDRNIAMVFQSYALYPSMTVRQNMTFGLECRHVPKRQQAEALDRVAKLLQIEALLDRRPSQLSGGQRQRVAMGRALVRDPLLFLFDEPLSNLDAKLRVEMRMEIKRLHQRLGSTIVYVTHDQIEAMTLATRIAVMNRGEVQQFADPDTVYNRPANLFVARFMGAPPMNTLSARLVASDGRLVAVLGDGEVRLPMPEATQAVGYVVREVVLGIRPECIAEADRRFGEGGLLLDAQVDMTEPTGAETIVLLRLGGHEVLGRIAPDVRLQAGATARFALDTRKICLFDPITERLID
jgi:multiple sugar transport system ATP-binding protein